MVADDTSLGDVVSHADDLAHGIAGDIIDDADSRGMFNPGMPEEQDAVRVVWERGVRVIWERIIRNGMRGWHGQVMSRQTAREIAMSIIAVLGDMELLDASVDDARMANALARAEALILMLAEQD